MAKKRKASGRNAQPSGPKEVDSADARLGPITTYEDIADSEEEYFLNRDKIMFDEEPKSKRRKRQDEEEEFLEASDEEIMDDEDDYDDDDDDDDDDESEEEVAAKSHPRKAASKRQQDMSEDEEGDGAVQAGEDSGWWGDSKTDYYDADQIETEADALEEEAEAKRLQKKKLAKMAEEDFLFDEGDWLASKPEEEDAADVVTEVLKDVEVTDDMPPEERLNLLQSRYPEFEHLVGEFESLHPKLASLKAEAARKPGLSIEGVKYWVLGCYVAALASYFGILTSPTRDGSSEHKILSPAELRDHEVMETLLECRSAWKQVSEIKAVSAETIADVGILENGAAPSETSGLHKPKSKEERQHQKAKEKAKKEKNRQAKAVEESLADLDGLLKSQKKRSKKATTAPKRSTNDDDYSDFGEEDALDARTAADKAARKKSLRFYTSQIVQKANRRADAGRDAGGDVDIPYRERLRDRQARLNAEAERRGRKDSKYGANLDDGGESNDDDAQTALAVRSATAADSEYYDMVAASSSKKKADKAARYAALAAASKADRVVEQEVVGEDGKRRITYAIEKNKGLTPKRSKDVRNPRVKKKKQYEKKQKKMRSMKATYKGGEPQGGYGGELTGISSGVVRARKL